jgi:hypothetical protein
LNRPNQQNVARVSGPDIDLHQAERGSRLISVTKAVVALRNRNPERAVPFLAGRE